MSSMKLSLLIVCLAAVAVQGNDPSCAFTRSTFNSISIRDQNGAPKDLTGTLFDTLQSVPDNMCKLGTTCCSKEAETSLYNYAKEHYRQLVLSRLTEPLMVCHNHTFVGDFVSYIEASRVNLVSLMTTAYGFYFSPYVDIFDKFYSYLQRTVQTGHTCTFAEEWNEVFYEVYLAAYFGHPDTRAASALPSTDAFRECFYQHVFLEDHGESLSINLNSFLRRYNRTMQYFRALRILNDVIVRAVDYAFSPQCAKSIMRMTYCSSCAGHVIPTCDDLCLNVLRGCLVDLSDLFEPFEELGAALVDLHRSISTPNALYFLWGQMSNLDRLFFEMVSNTFNNAVDIEAKLLTTCDANGRRSGWTKRQVGGTPRLPRFTVAIPEMSFNHSAYCLAEALSVMRTLPEGVCGASSTASSECWNGNSIGSYGRVVHDFDRDSQIDNPEVMVRNREFKQEIANLKRATHDLQILTGTYQCEADDEDEDCTVPETCEYYEIVDVPIEQSGSGSGSTMSGETTSPPDYTTTPVATTTCHPPGEGGSDVATGGPGVGPGGSDVCGPSTPDIVDDSGSKEPKSSPPPIFAGPQGSAASILSSSLTLIVLVLCAAFSL